MFRPLSHSLHFQNWPPKWSLLENRTPPRPRPPPPPLPQLRDVINDRSFKVSIVIHYRETLSKAIKAQRACYVPMIFLSSYFVWISSVTDAWGYFLWSNAYMYITSSGPESSPRVDFATQTGSWYNLKSVVNGTNVKIYVNNRLVKEITMSGKEANSRTNNYVGIWCHDSMDPIAGDSFKGRIRKGRYSMKKKKKTPGGRGGGAGGEGL